MKLIEIIGVILGIAGTVLLSTKLASVRRYRFIVFWFYFFSNILMALVFWHSKLYPAMAMQLVYFLTALNGIRNNWPEG